MKKRTAYVVLCAAVFGAAILTACDDSSSEVDNPDVGDDVGADSDANPDTAEDADGTTDLDIDVDTEVEECPDYGEPTDDVLVGYLSSLSLAGPDCCFANLDDDAAIDNDLAALVNSFGGLAEELAPGTDLDGLLSDILSDSIERGALSALVRITNIYEGAFQALPKRTTAGDSCTDGLERAQVDLVRIDRFRTTGESCTVLTVSDDCVDSDAGQCTDDGVCAYPLSSDADVQAGDGIYEITESLLGPNEEDRLDGTLFGGEFLLSGTETLNLPIDIGRAFAGQVEAYGLPSELILPIHQLRVRSTVAENTSESASDGQRGFATTTAGELGGAISIESVLDILNPYFNTCFDAEVPQALTIDVESNADRVELACDENLIADTPEALGGLCNLFAVSDEVGVDTTRCGLFDSVLGANLSIDTDDDGKADALSFGMNFELVGASLASESDD